MFRVLTWNVAGRSNKVAAQIDAIKSIDPDVVALQEVTHSSRYSLLDGLVKLGFHHAIDSFQFVKDPKTLAGPRRYGEVIASRLSLQSITPENFDIPWPERVLSCWLQHRMGRIEFHTTYIPPGSSNGWVKIETLEGIYRRLARVEPHFRILCGDFNSPDIEFSDGRVKVFGENLKKDGSIVPQRHRDQPPSRWSCGERRVILGLADFGLPDVFRLLHGYGVNEASWFLPQNKSVGRRFDHIFATPALNPVTCEYLHHVRRDGLSDHSALVAKFDPR